MNKKRRGKLRLRVQPRRSDEMSASAADANRCMENVGEERDVVDTQEGRIGGGASPLILFYQQCHCIHE